jgi:glycosyltransferase involved in cell wall biosynthesis
LKQWSIIIPALNEERHIGTCLDSICGLDADQSKIEVLVVDNGSTDRTVAVANSYSDRLDVRVLVRSELRVGALRNAAAQLASGRFLAFLDADCVAHPSWIATASRILFDNPGTITGSPYALPPDAGWPARIWHQRFHRNKSGEVSYVPGGNLLLERTLFWAIGGFDSSLRSNEDSQFCSRARSSGTRVLAFPELAVVHLGAEKNLRHFARRQLWHGSNVCSRAGIRGNSRAIGLAGYTLFCAFAIAAALILWQSKLLLAAFLGLLVPPITMAASKTKQKDLRVLPKLVVLILTYALVRAYALPIAAFRGARAWHVQQR